MYHEARLAAPRSDGSVLKRHLYVVPEM